MLKWRNKYNKNFQTRILYPEKIPFNRRATKCFLKKQNKVFFWHIKAERISFLLRYKKHQRKSGRGKVLPDEIMDLYKGINTGNTMTLANITNYYVII